MAIKKRLMDIHLLPKGIVQCNTNKRNMKGNG